MTSTPTPADIEIERCVLGCMLLDDQCRDERVTPRRFQSELHTNMCQTIQVMDKRRVAVDPVTVVRAMHRQGWDCRPLDAMKIVETVPHTANFEYYVEELVRVHKKRRLVSCARWLMNQANDPTCDPDDVWERLQRVTL